MYDRAPFLVIWESTIACGLACVHCRAEARPERDPGELETGEAKRMISEVKAMGTPIFIFSGGDPLRRPDLPELIRYAHETGLRTGAIPAVTADLTREKLVELKNAGLDQVAFSLDAAEAEAHDAFRKTTGVFDRTLWAVKTAHELGLKVQINTLVNLHNLERLREVIALVESLPIVFWEVFFLVPMGRGQELKVLEAGQFEKVFAILYELNRRAPFIVKVTEAPHYRRFVIEEKEREGAVARPIPAELSRPQGPKGSIGQSPAGVNSGKGFLFISHQGDVYPSGFLPIRAGNVRQSALADLYRESPIFRELRDASLLKGRCGRCEHKEVCGGSRSRAWALTGDYLAEDPACAYEPALAV